MGYNNLHLSDRAWDAFRKIPRSYFVGGRGEPYKDYPLPIPAGQTISAPHMYAMMLSEELIALKQGMDVLEIGTGSGYGAALLAYIVDPGNVYSIERHDKLVKFARENIAKLDLDNIEIIHGDGTLGVPGKMFDRILVTAAGPKIPPTLIEQLKKDGKLIMPLEENRGYQWLITAQWKGKKFVTKKEFQVRFVPLVGQHGFSG
jgi:protein-L-isoaspartate(D-aspartate) O-methyltransferase